MEERVGRDEIKGKNSSEITELFIFPALSLWVFEEATLIYLDVLGRLLPEAPQPPKGTLALSAAAAPPCCPCSLLKWILWVFTRPRVRNVCRVLAAAAARLEVGEMGSSHQSPACLFANQSQHFSSYYSKSPAEDGTPHSGRWGRNNKHW